MKTFLALAAAGLALLVLAAMAFSVRVSRPLFDERLDPATLRDVAIAPLDQALTFARTREERPRLLLVTRYHGDAVAGLDLTATRPGADPLRLLAELGYDGVVRASTTAPPVTVDAGALGLPFDAHARNVGVGANYPEHARESGLEEEPFVFPKIAQPTPHDSAVARAGSRLLDYEAELGLVALEDLAPGHAFARLGLVLANEVTDRWALVRGFARGQPMGTTGFADGKSRDGFAVLGPLLVVPHDLDAFYRSLELRLYVNGRLRQRALAGDMAWSPREVVAQVFNREDWGYRYGDATIGLLEPPRVIRAGTVVFSGTPAGVIFKPANLWNPWVYLQPGDEVVIRGDALGVIRNRVVEH